MKPIDKIKAQKISHIDPEENPVKACPNVSEFEKIAKAKAMKDIALVGRGEVSTYDQCRKNGKQVPGFGAESFGAR